MSLENLFEKELEQAKWSLLKCEFSALLEHSGLHKRFEKVKRQIFKETR